MRSAGKRFRMAASTLQSFSSKLWMAKSKVGHLAVGADLLAIDDQQHGGIDVAGDGGVDVELEGGGVAFEIGPFADDEVEAFGDGVVAFEDAVDEGGGLAGPDEFAGLAAGVGEGLLVGQVEPKVAGDERDVVVPLGAARSPAMIGRKKPTWPTFLTIISITPRAMADLPLLDSVAAI
jgi:hypothetical protein